MSDLLITNKFNSLPADMQKEVSDFIDFLQQKAKKQKPCLHDVLSNFCQNKVSDEKCFKRSL